MKNISKNLKLILLSLSLFVSNATASPLCYEPGWFGSLGFTGYSFHYKEKKEDNSFLMQDTGGLYGFFYSLGYKPQCMDLRFAVDGYFSWGDDIHYKSVGSGESKNNNKFKAAEVRLLGFCPWQLAPDLTLEGYTGYGGRVLANDCYDMVTTTGHSGYWRDSRYSYIPLGARMIKLLNLNCDMYLIGHLEYDWFLSGKQYSDIRGGVTNHQHSGYGARAGVDLQIPTGYANLDVLLGVFIRHWNIKDSTVNVSRNGSSGWYEPRNTTNEIGVNIGLVF